MSCRCPSVPLGVVPRESDKRCDQPILIGDGPLCWYCNKFCDPEAFGPAVNLMQVFDGRHLSYLNGERASP